MADNPANEPASDERLLLLLRHVADVASDAFEGLSAAAAPGSMRATGEREGQYALDLTVDEAVLAALAAATNDDSLTAGLGLRVLSEESGSTGGSGELTVVVDPVDGSSNASRGLPWFACSLCVVDGLGPRVALVRNLATGANYEAVRGGGARRDDVEIAVSGVETLADAFVVLNGHSPVHFGWRQYRALGATALDICAVADGSVDATIDCTTDALGPWDYLGAMLVLTEAGGHLADAEGRELVVLDHDVRRTPVCAASEALLQEALQARAGI